MNVTPDDIEELEPFWDGLRDVLTWQGMEPMVIGKWTQKFTDPRISRVDFIWYEIFIHLQFFIVGVKDGMRNGTISKKSCPSVFEVLLQAFVIVAIVSALKTFLPPDATNTVSLMSSNSTPRILCFDWLLAYTVTVISSPPQ